MIPFVEMSIWFKAINDEVAERDHLLKFNELNSDTNTDENYIEIVWSRVFCMLDKLERRWQADQLQLEKEASRDCARPYKHPEQFSTEAQYCEACQSAPCLCSDPDATRCLAVIR
jgi:hypothetical protein